MQSAREPLDTLRLAQIEDLAHIATELTETRRVHQEQIRSLEIASLARLIGESPQFIQVL